MEGIIFANIAAAAATAAVLIFRRLFKDKVFSGVFVLLWAAIIIRLLLPFEFSSAISLYPLSAESESAYREINVQAPAEQNPVYVDIGAEKSVAAKTPEPKKNEISTADAIFAVWVTGAVLCGGFFCTKHIRFVKKTMKNAVPFDEIPEDFTGGNIRIYESENLGSPLSFGFLRPVIIIPKGTLPGQLTFVLLHEQTHIKNRDAFIKLLGIVALCINWFDPFAWIAVKYLDRDLERCCDERVLSALGDKKAADYANTILDFAEKESLSISFFSAAPLSERIVSIMKNKNKKSRPFAALCLFAAVLITMTACGTVPKEPENNFAPAENTVFGLEMPFAGLEHGDTKILEDAVEVTTDNVVFEYQLTYASPTITLEVGLLSDDGTEYTAAVADGNGEGKIKDIPAGTYRLFVRNTGCIDIPEGKTVEGGAIVGKIISPTNEIESIEALLQDAAEGNPGSFVTVNQETGDIVAVNHSSEKSAVEIRDENNREEAEKSTIAFLWPCEEKDVASDAESYETHPGIDIGNEEGSAIYAAADGEVFMVDNAFPGFGKSIAIDHGEAFSTFYGSCSEIYVEQFDKVKAGDLIARTGSTEDTGEPHLHFELRKGKTQLDPMQFLPAPNTSYLQSLIKEGIELGIEFIRPVDEGYVCCELWGYQGHTGTDYMPKDGHGSNIYAVADGTVVTSAREHTGFGNHVVIDHGNGIQTLYAHCHDLFVEVGDEVKSGDVIASVGSTGNSTGPHLHFELRYNGFYLDPEKYLPET